VILTLFKELRGGKLFLDWKERVLVEVFSGVYVFEGVTSLACGGNHYMALTTSGSVYV
jgi:alpha-tubulin suppressor-like RCC1 family protein